MQKFNGSLIRQFPSSAYGNAANEVQVSVYISGTSTLADLYATDSTAGPTLANPVVTDGKGFYSFYAADNKYTLAYNNGFPSQEIQLVDVDQIKNEFDAIEASNATFKTEQQAAYDSFVLSKGWDQVGTFAAGFTYESPNQVGQDADGNWWRWNGAFPKIVTAGTEPSSDSSYKLVGDGVLRSELDSVSGTDFIKAGERTLTRALGNVSQPFVIIASGQSNALGRGEGPSPLRVYPDVKGWDHAQQQFVTIDLAAYAIITSGSSYGSTPAGQSARNSWPTAFAHRVYEETGRPVYLILDGQTATPISEWVGAGAGSARYIGWKNNISAALLAIGATEVDCILWHQGENDASRAMDDYYKDLRTLITQLKAESFVKKRTPFFAAGMLVKDTGPDKALQSLNYDKDPRTACISIEGFDPDGTGHINNEDLWELGYVRAWNCYRDTVNNVYNGQQGANKRWYGTFLRADSSTGIYEQFGVNASYHFGNAQPSASNNYLVDGPLGWRFYPEVGGYCNLQFPLTTTDKTMLGVLFTGIGGAAQPIPLLRVYATTNRFEGTGIFAGAVRSASDNLHTLGTSAQRWSTVYAATGTINTSDERLKTDLLNLEKAEKSAALEIKSNIKKYKFKDSVADKGKDARWHFGIGAQTAAKIMKSHGLKPENYAFFCYDEWSDQYEESPAIYDENGVVIKEEKTVKTVEAGSRYGIRYDELSMFILSAL